MSIFTGASRIVPFVISISSLTANSMSPVRTLSPSNDSRAHNRCDGLECCPRLDAIVGLPIVICMHLYIGSGSIPHPPELPPADAMSPHPLNLPRCSLYGVGFQGGGGGKCVVVASVVIEGIRYRQAGAESLPSSLVMKDSPRRKSLVRQIINSSRVMWA